MNKEVLYIDNEDDITDVINKVKQAKEKIVALVPPKNIGVLRSAVNLRLLARVAEQADKRVVLISNNSALKTMAATARIPVAKTLQSKPEIPEIDALEVDGEDVIDGEKLPVEAFMKKNPSEEDEILDDIDIDDNKSFSKKAPNTGKKKGKAGKKVPNFPDFRKKMFLIGGGSLILIGFLVWAIWFVPAATIIINAQTTVANVRSKVDLTTDEKLAKPEDGVLLSKAESIKKESEVSFDATGEKQVGEKAKGLITLSQNTEQAGVPIKSGTGFSSGDCTFITISSVVIPGGDDFSGGQARVPGTIEVSVQALDVGEQCNLSARTYLSPIGIVTARGGVMSGGSKKTIKVVTEQDVQTAEQKMADKKDENVKSELVSKFGDSYKIIDDSYSVNYAEASVSPKVGEEAGNGKASIKSDTTYTLMAINKKQLTSFLESEIKGQSDKLKEQKVYQNGVDSAAFSDFASGDGATSLVVTASGKTGPNIDEQKIKDQSKKKRYGEVQSQIKSIDGVKDVDVKFSIFWVRTVPDNDNKIKIEFMVDE